MRFTQRLTAYLRIAPGARRNRLDLTRYLLQRPAIAAGVGTYEFGLLISNRVETRTKALAALKAASLVGCEFCLDLGSATGRWLGITPDDLVALATYTHNPAFADRERLAIELAESLTRTPAGVTDELRARLGREFSAAQIMELAAEIAWENHRGRLNQGIGVRPMGFADGAAYLRPAALSTGTTCHEM
jgi:AhpD family alkylhydroperoxidase